MSFRGTMHQEVPFPCASMKKCDAKIDLKKSMFKVCKKEQEQVKQTTDSYLCVFVADL